MKKINFKYLIIILFILIIFLISIIIYNVVIIPSNKNTVKYDIKDKPKEDIAQGESLDEILAYLQKKYGDSNSTIEFNNEDENEYRFYQYKNNIRIKLYIVDKQSKVITKGTIFSKESGGM